MSKTYGKVDSHHERPFVSRGALRDTFHFPQGHSLPAWNSDVFTRSSGLLSTSAFPPGRTIPSKMGIEPKSSQFLFAGMVLSPFSHPISDFIGTWSWNVEKVGKVVAWNDSWSYVGM